MCAKIRRNVGACLYVCRSCAAIETKNCHTIHYISSTELMQRFPVFAHASVYPVCAFDYLIYFFYFDRFSTAKRNHFALRMNRSRTSISIASNVCLFLEAFHQFTFANSIAICYSCLVTELSLTINASTISISYLSAS